MKTHPQHNCDAHPRYPTSIMLVADDFGMNADRTDAILEAHRHGIVSRASLLVNGEDASRAAALGRAAGVPMGLHFNITEGFPLSGSAWTTTSSASSSKPEVADDDDGITGEKNCCRRDRRALPMLTFGDGDPRAGEFRGKASVFLALQKRSDAAASASGDAGASALIRDDAVDAVAAELVAQLNRFVELTGVTDVWLDGHNHVHVLDICWAALERVCFSDPSPLPYASDDDGAAGEPQSTASGARSEGGRTLCGRRNYKWKVVGVRVPHDPSLVMVERSATSTGSPSDTHSSSSRNERVRTVEEDALAFRSEAEIFGDPFWRRISSLAQLRRHRVPPHICVSDVFVGFEIGGLDCSSQSVTWKLETALSAFPDAPPRWRPPRLPAGILVVELMTHVGYCRGARHVVAEASSSSPALFQDDAKALRQRELDTYLDIELWQTLTEKLGLTLLRRT